MACRCRPVLAILREARQHQVVELRGNRQSGFRGGRLGYRMSMSQEELHRCLLHKYKLTSQRPEGDTAGRIDVGSSVQRDAQRLLRRNERRRAVNDVREREGSLRGRPVVSGLGDSKIEDLTKVVILAVPAQEDIRRLD